MKVLTDFDGVLTDLEDEAWRVHELFIEALSSDAISPLTLAGLVSRAAERLRAEPYSHGWKSKGRLSAFCDEDSFVYVNGLGNCLDDMADAGDALAASVRGPHEKTYSAMVSEAYATMVRETSRGERNPLDPSVAQVLGHLLKAGVEVVVVSNSGTDRICELLRRVGLAPVGQEGKGDSPEPGNVALRVRGHARKYELGQQPRTFAVGPYQVETDRPHYEAILREERPDVIVGDVFSLDLALPLHLSQTSALGSRPLQFFLRRRDYTPSWSLDYFSGQSRKEKSAEVSCVILERLDALTALV